MDQLESMHSGLVLTTPPNLVLYQGQLTEWNASDASSSRKGVKGLLSVSNRRKLALVSLISKVLNMSSQFDDGECLSSGMSIGGETLTSVWGSDHMNSDAITSRIVDEKNKLPEAPVELMLLSQWVSLMPIVVGVRVWFKWRGVMTTQLNPVDKKGEGICDSEIREHSKVFL